MLQLPRNESAKAMEKKNKEVIGDLYAKYNVPEGCVWVYLMRFFEMSGMFKVGYTTNLASRCKSPTDSPFDYELVTALPFRNIAEAKENEKAIHRTLFNMGCHYSKEWFKMDISAWHVATKHETLSKSLRSLDKERQQKKALHIFIQAQRAALQRLENNKNPFSVEMLEAELRATTRDVQKAQKRLAVIEAE